MKISFICSDEKHPVNAYIAQWVKDNETRHSIELVRNKSNLSGGDILFLISCSEIISASDRAKYHKCLVLHASDLPRGRGWSPHIWEISAGAQFLTLSLLEAAEKVDAGPIWQKKRIAIPEHALWDEINHLLFQAELQLITYAVEQFDSVEPEPQPQIQDATYFPRRTPQDSRLDPSKSIIDQFNLIRVCDPHRFPAFFDYLGHRYTLKVEKS